MEWILAHPAFPLWVILILGLLVIAVLEIRLNKLESLPRSFTASLTNEGPEDFVIRVLFTSVCPRAKDTPICRECEGSGPKWLFIPVSHVSQKATWYQIMEDLRPAEALPLLVELIKDDRCEGYNGTQLRFLWNLTYLVRSLGHQPQLPESLGYPEDWEFTGYK